MSGVDLSQFKGTLGPREAEALHEELRMIAQTRELALRRQVELEAANEALETALAYVTYMLGADDGHGKRSLLIPGEVALEAERNVGAFAMDPDRHGLHLVASLKHLGTWEITRRKPTKEEQATLPIFNELPVVTIPSPWTIILHHHVLTGGKNRIAEWTPTSS